MQSIKRCTVASLVLLVILTSTVWAQVPDLAATLFQAHESGELLPVFSTQQPAMDVKMAYDIQKAYVTKLLDGDQVAGLKAGLTSEAGQKKFGVDAPLAAVLFESGKLTGEVTLKTADFNLLMLETEIGFEMGEAITAPLKDVAELKQKVRAVMPVIEVPDLGFADMKQLKGVDIIAANVSAKQYIVGAALPVDGQDLNAVTVSLTLDGQEINVGKGSDALGDQWEAARWLINTMLEQGWTLDAGQMVITGALGKMIPGKPGKYVADYGDFGTIAFDIQ